jgi:hypothetical protein
MEYRAIAGLAAVVLITGLFMFATKTNNLTIIQTPNIYGQLEYHDDAGLYVLNITNSTSYYNVTTFSAETNASFTNGLIYNKTLNALQVVTAGTYKINFCESVFDGNNNILHITAGINFKELEATEGHHKTTANAVITVCGTGITNLNAGDNISLLIRNEGASTVNYYSSTLNVIKVA